MSDANRTTRIKRKAEQAHQRLDEHEQIYEAHDRRISRNENWRLQLQGGLKVIIALLGTGAVATLVNTLL